MKAINLILALYYSIIQIIKKIKLNLLNWMFKLKADQVFGSSEEGNTIEFEQEKNIEIDSKSVLSIDHNEQIMAQLQVPVVKIRTHLRPRIELLPVIDYKKSVAELEERFCNKKEFVLD